MSVLAAVLPTVLAAYGIGYAYAGWAIAAVSAVTYVVWMLQRGRRASQQVPAGRRRWSDPEVRR